jgi:hypothetical protein
MPFAVNLTSASGAVQCEIWQSSQGPHAWNSLPGDR